MPAKTFTKRKPTLIRRVIASVMPRDRGLSWETAAKILTAVGLFFVPLVVAPWSADPWELQKEAVLFVTVGAAWVCVLVAIMRRGHDRWSWHPLDILVLLFGLTVTLSAIFSIHWWSSLFGIPGWTSHSLLATWLLIGIYFLVVRLFSTAADRRLVWSLMLISVAGSLLVQMFQLSNASLLPEPLNTNQWLSTIGNLNIHAVIMAAILSTSALLLWTKAAERWEKMILAFGVVLGWVLLFISGRSLGWAIFALGIVAVVIHQTRNQQSTNFRLVMVAVVIAALGLVAQLTQAAKYSGLPAFTELTLDQNTTANTTWAALQDRFVLGTGPSTWYDAFVRYRPLSFNETPVWDIRFAQGSAGWLELLATIGIAGTALLAGVIVLGLAMAWRGWRASGDPLLLLTVLLLAVTAVSGLFTIWSWPLLVFTWAALGLARSTVTDWSRIRQAPMPGWAFGVATVGVLAGIALLWPFTAGYASNALTYRALQQAQRGASTDAVIRTLRTALQLDARNGEASKFLMNAYGQQVQELVTAQKLTEATTALNNITATANAAKRLDPNNPQLYETENQVLNALAYAVGDAASRAQANFQALRSIEPTNPIHDVGYGQTLMAGLAANQSSVTDEQRAQITQRAIAAYQEALTKKPDYFQARLSLMQALVDAKKPAEALAQITTVSQYTAIEQAYIAIVRAQALSALDKPVEAAAAIESGIAVYPDDPSLYTAAADYYVKAGQTDKAKDVLNRGRTRFPSDTTIPEKLKSIED